MTKVAEFIFIPTMDAASAAQLPEGHGWAYEIKFDGYRIQTHRCGDRLKLFSRRGPDFTDRYPEVASAILAQPDSDFIFDGGLPRSTSPGERSGYWQKHRVQPADDFILLAAA